MKDKNIQELINLYRAGKLVIVEKKVTKLIKENPKNFILYNLLGAVLADQKKFDQAIINYNKSTEINPNYAEVHNNLGSTFYKLRKFNESIDSYQRAVKIKPNFAEAYNNLGVSFNEIGKLNESVISYQRAIQIKSNYAEAYNNLGITFRMLNKINESIDNYQRAIEIKPDYAEAYNNLGNVLQSIDKIDEAILNYVKAIKINPNFAETYNYMGNLLRQIGRVKEAQKYFKKLINLKPDDIEHKINSALSMSPVVQSVEEINYYRSEYEKGLESIKKYKFIREKPANFINLHLFHLAYHTKNNLEIMNKTSASFRKIIPSINYVSKNIKKLEKQKKIKIGFISEFLTAHTIGKLFGGLIKNIDRKKFDIIIFHTSKTKNSLIKNEIDQSANKIVNLDSKIKEQQQQVEKESLDIIFYPDIGMSPTTYFLAFSRLAPVQIVSWGHPETTGIDTIDYFLSSTLLETDKIVKKYSERLICLSQFPLYYKPPQNLGLLKNRTHLLLPEKNRLYGCPQSLFKLHPDFDVILAKILEQDPDANVVLIGKEGLDKFWSDNLKKRWSKNFPVLKKKVLFTKRLPLLDFISLCNCVDVLLDPIYFGGGNTFLESMIVGTPTVTMPGTHLKANITAAAYKQMKISNPPIVKNSKEYINLAIELAKNQKKNHALREDSKIAANKYLYKNLKTLRGFERFLEKAHKGARLGNKLKDGFIIN